MKQIYALRLALGDPDYANVTDVLSAILSPEYALELESQIKVSILFQVGLPMVCHKVPPTLALKPFLRLNPGF